MTIEQTPHWKQPSHPAFISVKTYKEGSFSQYATASNPIPKNTVIADFSAATPATSKAYSSVQVSETEHIELNSDLLYSNHSCDPNVVFDTDKGEIRAVRDIKEGEPITFNYLTTEWDMAQAFRCECRTQKCLGEIQGAKYVPAKALENEFVNSHIKRLLEKRDASSKN
ncbi:hypothetical protein H072_1840 [Dactylellina haptotyla CBS 200.50]|uniref:SET domain-containing protein n=1 Tax=Dactylellina haptotyla (strain CBS 200.50) TaxID=1284197 RepID=S8AT24_DACHA|nr:hypothetical protein H072_1840 [Dactylellina haptotyla CBS 200.50]